MKEFEEIKVKVEKEFPSLCIDFKIVNEDLVEINYSLKNHPEIKTQIKYERFPMESVIEILTNDAFHQGITKSIEKRLLSERCIKK
jgi:hypothetical protein